MEWANFYGADRTSTPAQVEEYIASPLWRKLNDFLRQGYDTQPAYSYSGCAGQPGWNVKYQKAGRSLCTLYPMEGFFIALVVIGAKEVTQAELLAPTLSPHVQALLQSAVAVAGGRWLMIHVTDEMILNDVKQLVQLRRSTETN